MFTTRTLRAALRRAPPDWFITFHGPLFRVLPTRIPSHAIETNPTRAYRYNAAAAFRVLYASVDRETAQLESRRLVETTVGLAGVIDAYHIPVLRTEVRRLLNLCKVDVLTALGTSTQELTRSWRAYLLEEKRAPTHLLGAAAVGSGMVSGFWAPSSYATAENPRTNVVLFLDCLLADEYRSLVGYEAITRL